MSLVMLAGRRKNLWRQITSAVDPLPPQHITARTLDALGWDSRSEDTDKALTVVNHFAYGAAMGGIYGTLTERRSALSAASTGMVYGLGVWAGSYLGWLPVTGLYRSATEDYPERNVRMVVAHVVWGGAMGIVTEMASRWAKKSRSRAPSAHINKSSHPEPQRLVAKPR
jgi:putative membrane protein